MSTYDRKQFLDSYKKLYNKDYFGSSGKAKKATKQAKSDRSLCKIIKNNNVLKRDYAFLNSKYLALEARLRKLESTIFAQKKEYPKPVSQYSACNNFSFSPQPPVYLNRAAPVQQWAYPSQEQHQLYTQQFQEQYQLQPSMQDVFSYMPMAVPMPPPPPPVSVQMPMQMIQQQSPQQQQGFVYIP